MLLKVTKETRQVERKCFILEEGKLKLEEGKSKADFPPTLSPPLHLSPPPTTNGQELS